MIIVVARKFLDIFIYYVIALDDMFSEDIDVW